MRVSRALPFLLLLAVAHALACASANNTTTIGTVGPNASVNIDQHATAAPTTSVAPNTAVGAGPGSSASLTPPK